MPPKPKKKAAPKGCNCLEDINRALAKEGFNTRVCSHFMLDFKTGKAHTVARLETEKADSKKREARKNIIPTYCPFCGKKYPTKETP